MQNLLKINENKKKIENLFVVSNIVSIVSSPTKKTDQNEFNAIQDLLQCSRSSSYHQQKNFYKTWTFDCSSQKYSSEMVYQTIRC